MNRGELKKAYEEGLINEQSYKDELFKLETAGRESRKPKRIYDALSEEEFIKLLTATKKEVHKLGFILGYGSGLRISEILSLNPQDCDLKAHTIKVRQGKGSKDRITIIPKWFKERHKLLMPLGSKLGKRALEAAFFRASKNAGINEVIGTYKTRAGKEIPLYKFRVHSLRHSFCVRQLANNVPVNQVQVLLGHENLTTTARYSKANPIDAIERAWAGENS